MNLRLFSIGLLVSALPLVVHAEVKFNEGDFIAHERVNTNGEAIVQVKLSKSGKAKVRKLKAY